MQYLCGTSDFKLYFPTVDEQFEAAEQSHNFLQSGAKAMQGGLPPSPRSGIETGECSDGHYPEECGRSDNIPPPGEEDKGVQGSQSEAEGFDSPVFELPGKHGPGLPEQANGGKQELEITGESFKIQ